MCLINYRLFRYFNAKNIGYFFGNYLVEEINTRFGDMKINVAEENTKYEAIDNCLIEKDGKKQLVVSNTQRFKIE